MPGKNELRLSAKRDLKRYKPASFWSQVWSVVKKRVKASIRYKTSIVQIIMFIMVGLCLLGVGMGISSLKNGSHSLDVGMHPIPKLDQDQHTITEGQVEFTYDATKPYEAHAAVGRYTGVTNSEISIRRNFDAADVQDDIKPGAGTFITNAFGYVVPVLILIISTKSIVSFTWNTTFKEKETGFLMLQFVSGLRPQVYLIGSLLVDYLVYSSWLIPLAMYSFWGEFLNLFVYLIALVIIGIQVYRRVMTANTPEEVTSGLLCQMMCTPWWFTVLGMALLIGIVEMAMTFGYGITPIIVDHIMCFVTGYNPMWWLVWRLLRSWYNRFRRLPSFEDSTRSSFKNKLRQELSSKAKNLDSELDRYLQGRGCGISRDIMDKVWRDEISADQWIGTGKHGTYIHPKLKTSIAGVVIPGIPVMIQTGCDIKSTNYYPQDIAAKYLHMHQDNFFVAWFLVLVYGGFWIWWNFRGALRDLSAKQPEKPFGRPSQKPVDVLGEVHRVDAARQHGQIDDCAVIHMKKSYKRGEQNFMAVNDVTFGVSAGECFGFLGKNGAGKSTVMKMMTNLEIPSAGTGYIKGANVTTQSHEARNAIGYCPQEHAILGAFTGREMLRYMAEIKGVPANRITYEIDRICEILQLKLYLDKRCGTYSGGNKRKLSLGMALIGNRQVAFLDEPSTGVDPFSRRFMWDYIRDITPETAIILTTHNMEEGEALCSKIGIIVNGEMVCHGTQHDLKSRFMTGYILSVSATPQNQGRITKAVASALEDTGSYHIAEQDACVVKYSIRASLATIFELGESLVHGHHASDFVVSQVTLEDAFLRLTAEQVAPKHEVASTPPGCCARCCKCCGLFDFLKNLMDKLG